MSRLAFVGALLRAMRVDRWPAIVLVVLVLLTAAIATATPRFLDRVADEGVRHEVAGASAPERNIVFTRLGRVGDEFPSDDPRRGVEADGDEIVRGLPAPVRGLIRERTTVVDTVRYTIVDPPALPGYLSLRWQSGLEDGALRYREGRPPQGLSQATRPEVGGAEAGGVPFVEIALPVGSASRLGLRVGDVFVVTPDPADATVPSFGSQFPIAVELVGLYELIDPADERWLGDPSLGRPVINRQADPWVVYATGVVDPAAMAALQREPIPVRLTWWLHVEPTALDGGGLAEVVRELRRLETAYPAFSGAGNGLAMRTGLSGLLGRYQAKLITTEALLALSAVGPAAIGIGAFLLLGQVRARRRAATLTITRSRGASALQLAVAQVAEAALIAIPAAALGYLAGTLAVDGRPSGVAGLAVLGVALLALVAVSATALRATGGIANGPVTSGAEPPDDDMSTRTRSRRLVGEATIVALAVGGIVLLRQRGLVGASVAGDVAVLDPFLAGLPVLLGLAAGIVTLRIYPVPIRALAWLAGLRRDLVPALAMRRVGRGAGSVELPLLVVLLTVGVATFASVTVTTIDRGQEDASWVATGADFRVEPGASGLLPRLSLDGLPGVEAVADWHVATDARRGERYFGGQPVRFLALDAAAYSAVVAGTPIDVRLPAELASPAPVTSGSPEEAVLPAVVSDRQPEGGTPRPGDQFDVWINARRTSVEVVEVRDRFPGLAGDGAFVIVSLDHYRASRPGAGIEPTLAMVRAAPEVGPALADELERQIEAARLVSRASRLASVAQAPLIAAVRSGLVASLAVAAAFATLALLLAYGLAAASRRREDAKLAAIGMSRREQVGLIALEHAPPLLVALAAGAALGFGMAWLLSPALGLEALVGGTDSVDVRIDAAWLGAIWGVLLTVAAGALVVGVLAAGRRPLADEVRRVDA